MNNYKKFVSKNIDELAEWFDEYCMFDGAPWLKWWDKHFCHQCEPVMHYVPYLEKETECAWCEINKKCKYFQNMDDIPSIKEIIKMWLATEYNSEEDDVGCDEIEKQ